MAGVKGRSGGPRKNAGGKRPGAGRKPKAATAAKSANPAAGEVAVSLEPQPQGGALKRSKAAAASVSPALADGKKRDPLEFLELVVNDPQAPLKDRIRAAVAAAQYRHTKLHDGGKKDATADKAKGAAGGRFSTPGAPPRLAVAGGKRVS